ncbi:pentapeptide repeat-containing protein [Lysobacter sp. BMK333-48F3]|uniref:pentapeptide repeat-containing protein n=1 Tax=Lysobacter sp. BMK333-48F3 TaxID=2867962 RepID=UPI001C8C4266|nr:pentapeptide repeat-containing protein [Lysobacter sp. BMK333-48F3]MBX9402512.1 pentapeptide repeat-containing protein [Lysobacter sp. BMK333-48F3]
MKIVAKAVGGSGKNRLASLEITTDRKDDKFSDMRVDSFRIEASTLQSCAFTGIHAKQACFGSGPKMSYLNECVFERCDLRLSVAGRASLTECRFVECTLREVIALDLELINCVFERTVINEATFHGAVPAEDAQLVGRWRNEFCGNDFSSATLRDVGFNTGICVAAQTLPVGDDYLYIADTAAAAAWLRAAPVPPEPAAARQQKTLLALLDYDASTGQKDQLLVGPFPEGLREAAATFGSLLA